MLIFGFNADLTAFISLLLFLTSLLWNVFKLGVKLFKLLFKLFKLFCTLKVCLEKSVE